MASLRTNLGVNVVAHGWTALVQLVVVPVYLHRLGVEAYGLIGFSASVLISAQILELGLSQALTRELASKAHGRAADSAALFVSVERVYLVLAVIAGAAVFALAPVLAARVGSEQIPLPTVVSALELIAGMMALQLVANLYQAGLFGIERIGVASLLRVLTVTASAGGGVLLLFYVSNSVVTLFAWNAGVSAAGALAARVLLRQRLADEGARPRFQPELVRRLWHFASGMAAITAVSVLVSQLDRWLLINLLPLAQFGHYALAASLSGAVYLVVTPLFGVLFPRFAYLSAQVEEHRTLDLFRSATHVLTVTLAPLALTLAFFAYDVLSLWTRSETASVHASPILAVLVTGSLLNGLMNVPYALQLARGHTRPILAMALAGIALQAPALLFLALHWGPFGAAFAWIAFNITFAVAMLRFTQRNFAGWHAGRWFVHDLLPGVAASLLVLGAAKLAMPATLPEAARAGWLLGSALASVAAAAFAAPTTRAWLMRRLS